MKKNESVTFSGVWIIKRGSIYLHPYQVKVIPYILNILLHTRSILRSPLGGGGKAVTKGSSITVGRINPGA